MPQLRLQVATGFMAAICFNLIYNLILSQTVQWHTLVPIVDFMNHKTDMPVLPCPRVCFWSHDDTWRG